MKDFTDDEKLTLARIGMPYCDCIRCSKSDIDGTTIENPLCAAVRIGAALRENVNDMLQDVDDKDCEIALLEDNTKELKKLKDDEIRELKRKLTESDLKSEKYKNKKSPDTLDLLSLRLVLESVVKLGNCECGQDVRIKKCSHCEVKEVLKEIY